MLSHDLRFLHALVAGAHPDLIDVSLGRVLAGRLAAAIAAAERLEGRGADAPAAEPSFFDLAMGFVAAPSSWPGLRPTAGRPRELACRPSMRAVAKDGSPGLAPPKSALADFGTRSCRSRVNPGSVARPGADEGGATP